MEHRKIYQKHKSLIKLLLLIFLVFVISRLFIATVADFSNKSFPKGDFYGPRSSDSSLLDLFYRWDSGWYMSIINPGYQFVLNKQSSVAFFPLYPLLIKLFSLIFGNARLIGFIISHVALFFASVYLYKLVEFEFKDKRVAFMSVLYMLIFPVSFFFSIFYAEGLFLFLSISCFYYARRKKWLIASLLGFFLALTKLLGVFIFIPLLIEYLDISFKSFHIDLKKIKKDVFYLLLVPAGLFSYMLYLWMKFNDPIAFIHASSTWKREFSTLIQTFSSLKYYSPFYQKLFLIFVIFSVILILYLIIKKVRISYIVYSISLLLVYLFSNLLESVPRYIGVVFPIYISMALLGKKYRLLKYIFVILSTVYLAYFTGLFVCGYWFT